MVKLVAQVAALERPRKLAGQSDKETNWGCWECAFLLLSSWSLFQSYEICLQGTKSTKHLFHSPVSQCISLEYPRDNRAVQDILKAGRQIWEYMYGIIKLPQMSVVGS